MIVNNLNFMDDNIKQNIILLKSFNKGKKDNPNLIKKEIINKKGYKQVVYVKKENVKNRLKKLKNMISEKYRVFLDEADEFKEEIYTLFILKSIYGGNKKKLEEKCRKFYCENAYWSLYDIDMHNLNLMANYLHIENPSLRKKVLKKVKRDNYAEFWKIKESYEPSVARKIAKKDIEKIKEKLKLDDEEFEFDTGATILNDHNMREMGFTKEHPLLIMYSVNSKLLKFYAKELAKYGYKLCFSNLSWNEQKEIKDYFEKINK